MTNRHIPRALLSAVLLAPAPASAQAGIADTYRAAANRIIAAALSDSSAWNRLAHLTDKFGPRLSGSQNLERAIDWIIAEMRKDQLQNVRGEGVMVPRWVRGEEWARLVLPRTTPLNMIGLGGTIATPVAGVTADVMVVTSFDELTRRATEAKGKIVLFDVPFTTYGQTVRYRSRGAIEAARAGAVASLIRSVSSASMQNPHTGQMSYDSTVRRIPAAALSVEDAAMLHRMIDRGERVRVTLRTSGKKLPDSPSRNVVAELVGSTKPDEVVVLGGHIDSWDVGLGAMDDAGGVVAAWEAVRLLKRLGLRPKRTVRVVAWTNEENGGRGADGYRDRHRSELDKHVMAMESDNGVFNPIGVGVTAGEGGLALLREIVPLLAPIDADSAASGGGGADTAPISALGVPTMSPIVDGRRYFWYHHSSADTPDKLDPKEMAECVALMAVIAYVVADMDSVFPRAPIRGQ